MIYVTAWPGRDVYAVLRGIYRRYRESKDLLGVSVAWTVGGQ